MKPRTVITVRMLQEDHKLLRERAFTANKSLNSYCLEELGLSQIPKKGIERNANNESIPTTQSETNAAGTERV